MFKPIFFHSPLPLRPPIYHRWWVHIVQLGRVPQPFPLHLGSTICVMTHGFIVIVVYMKTMSRAIKFCSTFFPWAVLQITWSTMSNQADPPSITPAESSTTNNVVLDATSPSTPEGKSPGVGEKRPLSEVCHRGSSYACLPSL